MRSSVWSTVTACRPSNNEFILMDDNPHKAARKRRWWRFSLRTLFVLVTLIGEVTAWVVWSLNWISQRHVFIRDKVDHSGPIAFSDIGPDVPGRLWLVGEEAAEFIILKSASDTDEAQRLFPEARVIDPSVWNAP
jgi:hypothetical protein